jgi:membrane protein YdbS with pleckstrin-like domain
VFVSVDPRFVWGQLAGLGGVALALVGVAALIVWRSGDLFWSVLVVGGIIVVIVAVAVGAILEARRLAYQLRDHDLSLRSGVIRHRVETIPYSRVQHVSVGRGVIERALGLATLELSSAGPDIAVPGLSVEDAERIKQVVAERAGVDDESSTEGPTTEGSTNEWAPPSPEPPALGPTS